MFTDETNVHKNDVPTKTLQPIDQNKRIKTNKTIGKGVRFVVINAGDEDGFIPNAELIVYKKELNSEDFENYMEFQLMPNIPENSIVIMITVQYIRVNTIEHPILDPLSKQLKIGSILIIFHLKTI